MTSTLAPDTDLSVLVVDDEPQVVWVLQFTLETQGYATISARDSPRSRRGGSGFRSRYR